MVNKQKDSPAQGVFRKSYLKNDYNTASGVIYRPLLAGTPTDPANIHLENDQLKVLGCISIALLERFRDVMQPVELAHLNGLRLALGVNHGNAE